MSDANLQAKVSRLRQLISEAAPIKRPEALPDRETWAAFDYYEFNTVTVELDQSVRARAIRAINRISNYHGWSAEVKRFLDRYGACSLAQLDDLQVEHLAEHMAILEGCAQSGCDVPDCPPAR